VQGWWVDEAIQTVVLPNIKPGKHTLILSIDFTRKTELEWCYLLGDFGVNLVGRTGTLIAPVKTLGFGDWTKQGLPFYAGNVTYHCSMENPRAETWLQAAWFKGPLLTVDLDQQRIGPIAFPPFELKLPTSESTGKNLPQKLDITVYGNRVNAFGALHHTDATASWMGAPGSWRSVGQDWSYEYQLKPMGLLVAPALKTLA
jgi:hypothetical protein